MEEGAQHGRELSAGGGRRVGCKDPGTDKI